MNYYGALKVEKLLPINHGENTLLRLDTKPFGICDAFAQCCNTGPAMLKTPVRTGSVSIFKPRFYAKPPTWAKNPSENRASPHLYAPFLCQTANLG